MIEWYPFIQYPCQNSSTVGAAVMCKLVFYFIFIIYYFAGVHWQHCVASRT